MTEVLLLLVALLLALACGAFVAAEFSLTTVERGDLERAVERGDRGAAGALKAVRSLTYQLSGAQLGITVTNLVVGMLSEPSISKLIRGPVEATGLSPGVSSSLALVIGTALSTVVLMVVGELVPKNWAISSPLAVARTVAAPQRAFTAVFRPFISHLNNTANRIVRRFGLEPAEELASARSPQELVALARHSAKEGALEADTAELFVRTLNLSELTAENVMTPVSRSPRSTYRRPPRTSRTPPGRPDSPGSPSTGAAWTRSSASRTSRTYWRSPPTSGPVSGCRTCCASRCSCRRRSPWTACWTGSPESWPWPSSSTSTAAQRES